jgi:hypothetical protein
MRGFISSSWDRGPNGSLWPVSKLHVSHGQKRRTLGQSSAFDGNAPELNLIVKFASLCLLKKTTGQFYEIDVDDFVRHLGPWSQVLPLTSEMLNVR